MRMHIPTLGVAALAAAALAGCGAGTSATPITAPPSRGPSVSPGATPTPSPAGLFAVLEGASSKNRLNHSQVVIVSPDGYALSRASFTPRPDTVPYVCGAAAWLMPEAYAAAGAVFFVDALGVVRRLDPSGAVRAVTTFPFDASHQLLSFVVSPDGRQVMATILTVPTYTQSTPPSGCGTHQSDFLMDVYLAGDGGAAQRLTHTDAGPTPALESTTGFKDVVLVGWDSNGPVADVGAAWETQNNPWPGTKDLNGQLTRYNTDGTPGAAVGGSGCTPYAAPAAGAVICIPPGATGGQNASVRSLTGSTLWTGATRSLGCCFAPVGALNADGSTFAREGQLVSLATGATSPLAAACDPAGWIDAATIVCADGSDFSDLGVVHVADPTTLTDWHVTASFVGRLASP